MAARLISAGDHVSNTQRKKARRLQKIADALSHFDTLPDSAHVRQPAVEGLYGCSSATVWRNVKRGLIPAPVQLSNRVTAWNVGSLRRALKIAAT